MGKESPDVELIVKHLKEWVKDKDSNSLAVIPTINFIEQYERKQQQQQQSYKE